MVYNLNMKFTFITFILVAGLIVGGYFAYAGLTDPAKYVALDDERIGDLRPVESGPDDQVPVADSAPVTPTPTTTTGGTSKNADLIAAIQKIIDKKVTLKVGSKGADVGTVQTFMNLYFAKTAKVDNDFGKILEGNVKTFQTQNKLPVTGQVAAQTLGKMIEWLKNH